MADRRSRPRLYDPKTEHIVTAWAEPAAGPGWANRPLWVLIRDGDGKLRVECIQPADQTVDMHILYSVSAAVHAQMTRAVEGWNAEDTLRGGPRRRPARKKALKP